MTASPEITPLVRSTLKQKGRTVVRVVGRSMAPRIKSGERIEIEATALDQLRVGDIVAFYNGRVIICHRLLAVRGRMLTLKGDVNLWMDPPVLWEHVLGKGVRVIGSDLVMRSLTSPSSRRASRFYARFSYPYALWFTFRRWVSRLLWHGIEWE